LLHAHGNTLSKLAVGIADTIPTIAIKSHLKHEKPVVLAVASGTGLSTDAENIGKLLNRKNYYFVPVKQDNPITKPNSVVFDPTYIKKTLEYALDKQQIQPVLL